LCLEGKYIARHPCRGQDDGPDHFMIPRRGCTGQMPVPVVLKYSVLGSEVGGSIERSDSATMATLSRFDMACQMGYEPYPQGYRPNLCLLKVAGCQVPIGGWFRVSLDTILQLPVCRPVLSNAQLPPRQRERDSLRATWKPSRRSPVQHPPVPQASVCRLHGDHASAEGVQERSALRRVAQLDSGASRPA